MKRRVIILVTISMTMMYEIAGAAESRGWGYSKPRPISNSTDNFVLT